jgi:hypothetical protein
LLDRKSVTAVPVNLSCACPSRVQVLITNTLSHSLCIICAMSDPPGTHVFSLDSALSLSFLGDSRLEPLDFATSQSCFAVSRSFAETRNLSQHWRSHAVAVSGHNKPIFVHSNLSAQQGIESTSVDTVAAMPGEMPGCSRIYAPSNTCRSALSVAGKARYFICCWLRSTSSLILHVYVDRLASSHRLNTLIMIPCS